MYTRWIVLAGLLVTLAVSPARAAEDGLVTRPSKHMVVETADRREAGLRQAGATVFVHIDYAQSVTALIIWTTRYCRGTASRRCRSY